MLPETGRTFIRDGWGKDGPSMQVDASIALFTGCATTWQTMKKPIDLAHELAHARDYHERGEQANTTWFTIGKKTIPDTEKVATLYENHIRQESGLPLRTHYMWETIDGIRYPYEPSRIITLFYPSVQFTPFRKRRHK